MASYLLIESRDPTETNEISDFYDLATGLQRAGNTVTLFFVQNGVFPARRSPLSRDLEILSTSGIEMLADEFSLRERGITADRLVAGIQAASLDVVVDRLAAGSKTLWH
jgi:predicted peroxiredoxin